MSSREERQWYKQFYNGTFLVKGWKHRVKEVTDLMPDEKRADVKKRLEALGEKMGREWARDNSVRRIDTATLQKWGESLQKVTKNGFTAIDNKIIEIDREVDEMLV